MKFDKEQIDSLKAPLDPKHVATRSQLGHQLSYIEGWHAIAEANRIFGFDGWHRETVELREVRPAAQVTSSKGKETWRVGFMAKVRITVGEPHSGIVREGTGYGSGAMPDLGDAYESAVKEAETDAMKRALMTFGNPFGLALYDKSQANVSKPFATSAHMNRELEKLDSDLADVASTVGLSSLWKDWQDKMFEENWPIPKHEDDETAHRNQVLLKFKDRKASLLKEQEAA
jgi:DNA recombination protein Rad52